MVSTSLKPSSEIFSLHPSLIPQQITFDAFINVLQIELFRGYVLNSFIVAVSTTLISVALSCLAGYGFSKFQFRGRRGLLTSVLCAQMLPGVILLMPMFSIMARLQLIDTHLALILAYVTFTLPYCTWIMTAFYKSIPKGLEEAALVDGATRWQAFVKVIPQSIHGIISTSIFAFIIAWDEFVYALTLTKSEEMRTLPYGLYSFMSQYGVEWNNLMAVAILAILPPLLLFLFLQRFFTEGLLTGGMKQ